jgi:hypothetical protein
MPGHQVRPYVHLVSTEDPNSAYEIRVREHLDARWATRFDGLAVVNEDDGSTALRGPVVDQAALHGLLQRLRDLGLTLLSLERLAPEGAAGHADLHDDTHHHTPGATS